MKKILSFLGALLIFATFTTTYSQVATDSWAVGFGGSYPRYFSSDLRPLEASYGGFISIQRNFTESVSLRLKGVYQSVLGRVPGFGKVPGQYSYNNGNPVPSVTEEVRTTVIGGRLDFIYQFVPCEAVNPYIFGGFGMEYYDPVWPDDINNSYAQSSSNFKFNAGAGANWNIGTDWKVMTELGFNNQTSKIEGVLNNGRAGIFGSNTTMTMEANLGFLYYFDKGAPSKVCQLYSGIDVGDDVDYERIENIVKKYIPREVVKEVVVKVPVKEEANWVLVGVNFDFNKSSLTNESYPVLWHATQVLLSNPDLKVEIAGHTDGIGSDDYNLKLSEKRSQTVKDYLVARGVAADRMVVKGYGKSQPIASNDDAKGRAMNRRIEFKVMN